MGRHAHLRRCAAFAARVCRCRHAAERVLLRASQDRVLAMSFECGHDLGRSRGLRLAIVTAMWGSWRAEPEVRSADATSVRCDALIACTRKSTVNSQYSSVLESLLMILSVLSVSDCG